MRARLAICSAGVDVRLREVVLRDKPQAFLDVSPSATVPCLVTDEQVVDESLDIMVWALTQNDPEGWMDMPEQGWDLIAQCDGPFKHALDRTKYSTRYPDEDADAHCATAVNFLEQLDRRIDSWLFRRPTLADYALLPFIRQFAFIDKPAFDRLQLPNLQDWLSTFLDGSKLAAIMHKYPQWNEGDAEPEFP